MPDREKVISRLENWRESCPFEKCAHCGAKGKCTNQIFDDALALLREHEAQLIKLADLLTNHSVVWLEDVDKSKVIPGIRQMPTDTRDPLYIGYHTENGFVAVNLAEYNKRWRAWTQNPSDAQRKAVEWNE